MFIRLGYEIVFEIPALVPMLLLLFTTSYGPNTLKKFVVFADEVAAPTLLQPRCA